MSELAMYEKKLTCALNCPKPMQARLLERFRGDLRDFCAGEPDMPWEQVEDFLGNPDELVRTMLEQEDQDALERYRKRKRNLKRAAVGGLAAAFLLSFCVAIYIYQTRRIPVNITVTETLIIGEENQG